MSWAVRYLHVVSAVTWIGGMLFIALVLVPVTRRIHDPTLRTHLVRETGLRFRTVGWVAVVLLVLTGLGNLWLRPELLWTPRFQGKAGLVLVALILSALHDFVIGPRAALPGADPTLRAQATWVARLNVLVVLVIVALGLALRG